MNRIDRIKELIMFAMVKEYRIHIEEERTAELFFVRDRLDMRRIKDVTRYRVTVFRTEERDGQKLKASAEVILNESMLGGDGVKALRDAYYAAQFAMNPYYEAADPVQSELVLKATRLAALTPEEAAVMTAKQLFSANDVEGAFINSAEVFAVQTENRIVTSSGTDVSWTDAKITGEYVVQAKEPEDVEMYKHFGMSELDEAGFTASVREALTFVRDRAHAERILRSGSYDLILSGENVAEVLNYFAARSAAAMIYPHYSTWQVGDDVQGETAGERLSLTLLADAPFSNEGVPMTDRALIEDGRLKLIHGATRFCRYLGVEPTGDYRRFACGNEGSMSFEEMKKTPCLWAVTFSDFQMDPFSGLFGGEIRLAYLIVENGVTPVTGGSVNGSLLEAEKDIAFSTDRFTSENYSGPYAMKLRGIAIAGSNEE
ncbi:MAG: hypothetical protein IJM85_04435 [Clostridia bacterium]|nr:hypothetical protein [Clostridia bacterium]